MHGLTLTLYALAGLGFVVQLIAGNTRFLGVLRVLYLLAASTLLSSFVAAWVSSGLPSAATPQQALSMLVLFSSLALVPLVFRERTAALAAFFLPAAAIVLAFSAPFSGPPGPVALAPHRMWYVLHTVSVIAGEALLLVASVSSGAYLLHERMIRHGDIHLKISRLPPLTVLDWITAVSLASGFCAISAGMITGGLWATATHAGLAGVAPKAVSGGIIWSVCALCVHQRFAVGWKGRRTAIMVLFCLALMAVLFVGMNTFFPFAHGVRLI
ncbi:MAG TPA: cytochrome c biogenesis protein CcsA [Deltaproteobacteria bacterium]|nr:cytochrome c biogenesis protein CcsA [Deltaproteobacteria bacterium]HPP79490.1 cytochrome c biogenesis protein CcsA [Deltaproteobacteria bacterium]